MNVITNRLAALACVTTLAAGGLSGCASMNNTQRGGAAGAGIGGAIGAGIGHNTDRQAHDLEGDLGQNAEVSRVGEGIAVTFASGILFPFNSFDVLPAGRENLRQLAQSLQRYPGTEVLIVGHTDNVGSDAYNLTLSQRRAESAKSYLVSMGIPADRIRTAGRGEAEPIASNDAEAGRQQNRRVEIAIFASQEYREQILREYGRGGAPTP